MNLPKPEPWTCPGCGCTPGPEDEMGPAVARSTTDGTAICQRCAHEDPIDPEDIEVEAALSRLLLALGITHDPSKLYRRPGGLVNEALKVLDKLVCPGCGRYVRACTGGDAYNCVRPMTEGES